MSKFDAIYNEIIQNIVDNGIWDKDQQVRTKWIDGTPAYTKSIINQQIKLDNSEVPILTTKKVAWKTATKEMLLFWQQQTVREKDFHENNVYIWDEWFKNGTIGRSYAYQFESHRHHFREIIEVKPILKVHHGELKSIIVGNKENIDEKCNDELCGKVIKSQNSGEFVVLDVYSGGKENNYLKMAKVQFLDTNYVTITTKGNAKKGKVKDLYSRRVKGVGYEGNVDSVKNYTKDEIEKLRTRWMGMLGRCYDKNNNRYKNYGDCDIFVDERWHSFENYLRDIRCLPQFILAREDGFNNYQLDKDYFGSNCYSKDTCVWLSAKDNITYKFKPFKLIHPDNSEELFLNITDAQLKYNLNDLSCILAGKVGRKSSKGYTAKYIEDDEHLYRFELSKNQIVELLHNLKNNYSSRRLMTSFWNHADVDKKQLQECVWATHWQVMENKLHLTVLIRSNDSGLGCPFNVFQYYVLQRMIAQVTEYELGTLTFNIDNIHAYERHLEPLQEQIKREQYEAPELWINPNVKNFYDFTIDDFKLINYQHGDTLRMEVAI